MRRTRCARSAECSRGAGSAHGTPKTVSRCHAWCGAVAVLLLGASTLANAQQEGLTLSPSSGMLTEGGAAVTYTVVLNTQPTADVTVTVTSADTGAVTVDTDPGTTGDQSTLTFTSSNWNTTQTVTLSAVTDADAEDETVAITNAPSGGGYGTSEDADYTARVTDNDTRGLTLSPDNDTLTEGGAAVTYTVVLNTQPTADVTVRVTSADTGAVTVDTDPGTTGDQSTLTFTSSNWNTTQTVTLSAVTDADAEDETVAITNAPSGGGYSTPEDTDYTARVTDNDTRGLTLSPDNDTLTEGGAAVTYTVVLNTQPTADVTVTVTSADTGAVRVDTDPGTTGDQSTLTFTSSNWNTTQTVTLSAVTDADAEDETVAITNAPSGGGYGTSEDADYTASVTDNDTRGLTLSPDNDTLTEGGAAVTYTVVLNTQPTADVTVTVTSADTGAVTVDTDPGTTGDQSTLTFTSSNWNTTQTVTLSAVTDADAEDETVAITNAPSGGGYSTSEDADYTASVTDNDTRGLTLSPDNDTLTEGGAAVTYTVVLNTQPTADVTVTVTSADTGAVTVDTDPGTTGDQSTLTFTSSNWNTTQTVTLSAVTDADAEDETVAITNAPSGGGYGTSEDADYTASVTDNDTRGLTLSPTSGTLAEGGAAVTYTVVLDTQPTTDVTVTVTSADTGAVTVDTDPGTTGDQSTLTFTSSNWDATQTVTLSAVTDADAEDESVVIANAPSGGGYGTPEDADYTASVTDNDTRGLTLSPTSGTLAEGGAAVTYTVVLDTQPTTDVTVTVTSADTGAVTVDTDPGTTGDQSTLTFTSSNWDATQTVTLSAVTDADAEDESVVIANAPSGGGYGTPEDADYTASVTDNDTRGLTLSPTSGTLAEGGAAVTYTVVLDTQPTTDVTVTVTSADTGAVTVDTDPGTTGDQSTLTFTSSNWDATQTVTLSAVTDADAEDESVVIANAPSGGGYGTPEDADYTASVTDNDTRGLTLSPTSGTLAEGGAAVTYTVLLDTQPTTDVTVTVTSADTGAVTVDTDPGTTGDQSTLTFTSSNWDATQTVTLSAVTDADAEDESVVIANAPSGGGYGTPEDADYTASVTDNDTRGLTLSPTSGTLAEGGAAVTYTVLLDTQPTTDVTVTVTSADTGAVTVDTDPGTTGDQSTLTFTSSNWDATQTVTLSAVTDADAEDESVVIANAPSGGGYGTPEDADYTASVTDNDTRGLTLSPTSGTLAEGGAAVTYTVVLDTQPTTDVTVTVTSADTGAVRVDTDPGTTGDQSTLTFTSSNWDATQTVTLSAVTDADAEDESVVIANAPSGGGYGTPEDADYTASVTDNDTRGLTLSPTSGTLAEGGAAVTYTVVLDTQPTTDVTVTVTSADTGAVTVDTDPGTTGDQSTLTFTSSNWDATQTVTLSAVTDADAEDESVVIANAPSGGGYGTPEDADYTASVTDNDTRGLTLSPTSGTLAEGGAAVTYTVVLDTQPTTDVTVTVTSADTGAVTVDTDPGTTGDQSTLTFTSSNWDATQTVTLSAVTDADAEDETVAITNAPSGGGYGTSEDADYTASVTDDDARGLTLSRTEVDVPEDDSATYTVLLDTQPQHAVTFTVARTAGSDTDLDWSPATLTFSTTNYGMPQTVTVSAGDDADGVAGTATFTHTTMSADIGYNNISIDSVVATEVDDDDLAVSVAADSASVNEGTAARFTVTVSGAVTTEELTVEFTISGTAIVGRDYTAPSSTILTIATGSPSGSISIATIEDSILDDGETLIVTLSSVSNTVDQVTIGTPNSAEATIGDDSTVTLSLSNATVDEGEPAEFTVTMSGRVAREVTVDWATADDTATAPEDYAAAAGSLTFRPDEPLTRTLTVQTSGDARAEGEETFVVRLSNPTGPSGVSLDNDFEGAGTILDDIEAAAMARHERVNQEALPRVTQAMVASTLSAITGRIDAAISGAPPTTTTNLMDLSDLDRLLRSSGQALGNGTMTLERFLHGSSFVLPLGGTENRPGLAVWGSVDYRELSGDEDSGVDWKGDVLNFHLGADTRLRPDLLVGFSVSRSFGSFDYTDRTNPLTISGDYETQMTSVHPYVNWSVREGLEVWTMVGYGRGEVEIKEEGMETRLSDTEMKAAAVGLNRELLSKDDLVEGGTTTLRLKSEGSFARIKLEGNDRMNPLTSDIQRVRMSLEASHDRRLASGSSVIPSLEVGLRYDGGDGVTGAGAELGGTLRYHDPAFGLTVEGRARVLVTHRDDYEEWGVGGLVRVDPGGDGRGLSLNVTPTWGKLESKHSRLYDQGTADLEADDNKAAVSLDAEIGYGWGTSGGRGLFTPYGGLTLSGADEQRYRLGGRFELGRSFDLSLEGERRETGTTADHSLMLRAQLQF